MQLLINGQSCPSAGGQTIPVTDPVRGTVIDTVPAANEEDLAVLFSAAEEGKKVWKHTSLRTRCDCLFRLADRIAAERESLARMLSEETGKSLKDARTEMARIDTMARSYAERAAHLYGHVLSPAQAGSEDHLTLSVREPLGIVLCIIPYNYPVSLYMQKVAPALLMGNAVIVKPATDCPLTLHRITRFFWDAGVPGNVIQLVTGRGSEIGDALVSHPSVNAVTLTGSTASGIHIAQIAAARLTHVHLELGGNDATIVFEDADLEAAAKGIVTARSKNAGQTCAAVKRILVHRSVQQDFTDLLLRELKKIRVGDPEDPSTDVGSLISERAAAEVEEQVQQTLRQGASLLLGDGRRNGAFFPMTVLGDVTEEMDIAKDMEIFGPVFPIIAFDTEEEAIRIANQSSYGLCAGVISRDLYRGIRVAQQLEAGSVVVNDHGNYRTPELAFGGFKFSGVGREGVSASLEEMSQEKSYTVKGIVL